MTESTPATISTGEVKRFRLLIIGKTGCGKTTILSKVCGKNMIDAPSTSRGVHNIENEILFQKNDKLVAHDSEGFESGQSDELDVVKKFIERRSKAENMSERLHMVWSVN
jgi:predicted GTPase